MDNREVLKLMIGEAGFADILAEAITAAVGEGPQMGRVRAVYGVGREISTAIGKEMCKITMEGEPRAKRRVSLMTGDNGGRKKGGL